MSRPRTAAPWAALAAALALAAAGCAPSGGGAAGPLHFPARLQGLAIVDSIGGEAARTTLQRMHGKGVAPVDSRIGVYGGEALPTLVYVSRYADVATAAGETGAMVKRIGTGSSGFVARRTFRAGGVEVHEVAGHGQAHFYFARGPELVWLSAPPDRAAAMLAELLGIPGSAIPR